MLLKLTLNCFKSDNTKLENTVINEKEEHSQNADKRAGKCMLLIK